MSSQNDIDSTDNRDQNPQRQWKGLAEIDQAIHDNRMTKYRVKKAWADPWSRIGLIVLMAAIAAFVIYVAVDEIYY